MAIPVYPDFWEWLINLAELKIISIPEMVFNELIAGNDALSEWMKKNKDVLLDQTSALNRINEVMEKGYGSIDETTLDALKADPWVIAHALALEGIVVTSEKPGKQTAPRKKKIPAVCIELHVPCCTITSFLWQMRAFMPR